MGSHCGEQCGINEIINVAEDEGQIKDRLTGGGKERREQENGRGYGSFQGRKRRNSEEGGNVMPLQVFTGVLLVCSKCYSNWKNQAHSQKKYII